MPRAFIWILIGALWVIFTAGVIIYQDRDGKRAGEHPESDEDMRAEPDEGAELEAAA